MKIEKSLKILAFVFVLLNLFVVLANSQIPLPKNSQFGVILSRGSDYANYIDTTYESGLQKLKTSSISVSMNSPIKIFYSSNQSVQWEQFSFDICVDLSKLKNALSENIPERSVILYSITSNLNFWGAIRNVQFSLTVFRNNNHFYFQYGRYYEGLMATFQTVNYSINSVEMRNSFFESQIIISMTFVPNLSRNFGKIYTNSTFFNKTGPLVSILQGVYFETEGLFSAGTAHIASAVIDSYFYYGRTLSWNIVQENHPAMFAKALVCFQTPQDLPILPTPRSISLDDWGQNPVVIDPNLENKPFWNYSTFNLEEKDSNIISFSRNYSVYNESLKNETEMSYPYNYTFKTMKVVQRTEKYYYSTQAINPLDWGNWVFTMFKDTAIEANLDFNFIRNGLVWVVNAIVFLFQAIFYLLIVAFNYLIVWLLLQIIVLIWNYPIYWIVFAVIAIAFWITFFFVWLWNQAVILWKMVIEPIFVWIWNWVVNTIVNPVIEFFQNGGLKILFDLYMIVLSYILAILLFIFTFGTIDFVEIQQSIQSTLLTLNNLIFEFVSLFLENFVLLLGFVSTYVLLIGLIYVKYIYTKSRGYITRANRLQSMINVYKLPIVLLIRISQYVIGFIQGGVPTDGANE